MTAARILAELRARGATARPRGEHIIVSPRSALTGELRAYGARWRTRQHWANRAGRGYGPSLRVRE